MPRPPLPLAALMIAVLLFVSVWTDKEEALASPVTEEIWGIAQECSYNIAEAENSIDLAFNYRNASCLGDYANGSKYWAYTDFQDTTIFTVTQVILDVRFYFSRWENDTILLQISNNNGDVWTTLDTFDEINPPPNVAETKYYDVTSMFTTPDLVRAAQVWFRGDQEVRGVDIFSSIWTKRGW